MKYGVVLISLYSRRGLAFLYSRGVVVDFVCECVVLCCVVLCVCVCVCVRAHCAILIPVSAVLKQLDSALISVCAEESPPVVQHP